MYHPHDMYVYDVKQLPNWATYSFRLYSLLQSLLFSHSINSINSLFFLDPPKSVQLLSGSSKEAILGAISAPEGEEQRIQCLGVGGSPPPQLKWYLGDRELDNAHRAINSAGNVVSTVTLRMSRRDHGKALRCSAVHPALTTIVDVKSFLDVQCKCFFT